MSNIWVTSDTHFGHKNIVRGISTWDRGFRDFATLEEHDETILDGINSLVGEHDILYHLGDFAFGVKEISVPKYRNLIKCKNIHILNGNHDKYHVNKANFSSARDFFEGSFGKHYVVMCHYPLYSWNNAGRGSIHLHGHQHLNGNLKTGRIKDLDIAGNNFKPYNLEELLDEMSKIPIWTPDHHSEVR